MAIGLNVPEPEGTCSDTDCPFHGTLSVRGQLVEGRVASTSMDKTVVVEREYDVRVPKYDRLMKRRSRISAHHPDCLELSEGDTVRIAETRPLSKTKSHVVVELVEEAEVAGGITAPTTEDGETTSSDATDDASGDRSSAGES
jgi:small subunit ribosomal protein S17